VWDAELAKPVLVETVPFWQGDTGSVELASGLCHKQLERLGVHVPEGECIEFEVPDWVPVGRGT